MRDHRAGRLLDRLLETSGVILGHGRARHGDVDVAEPSPASSRLLGRRAKLAWLFAVGPVVDDHREPLPLKFFKIRKFRLWSARQLLGDCNGFHRRSFTWINKI